MRTKNELIKRREQLYEAWRRLPDEEDAENEIERWNIVAAESRISGEIDALDWVLEYDFEVGEWVG